MMSKICEPHSVPTTTCSFYGAGFPRGWDKVNFHVGAEVKRWYFGHLPQILGVFVGRILHKGGFGHWAKGSSWVKVPLQRQALGESGCPTGGCHQK